jgi:glycosyltransferase involved in cell wall biosynthesis
LTNVNPVGTDLAVCVATYKRPEGLERLLRTLAAAAEPAISRLVLVDNDEMASARAVVDGVRDSLPWPVHYEVETERGVSAVRNRAVRIALEAGADAVAFIDDDEIPQADWAAQLLAVHRRTGAPVVMGGVDFTFESPAPPWLAPFYSLPEHPDGAPVGYAITSNVLITADVLRSVDPVFDLRYGASGSEDTQLFERLRLAGTPMVYAAHSRVTEIVTTDRIGVRWILDRERWRATMLSVILRDLRPSPARYLKRVGAAVFHIGAGVVGCACLWRGRRGLVAGAKRIALGTGLLAGLVGPPPRRYV